MSAHSQTVEALREIASMTFDPWTNGARAGEIAKQALAALAAPTAEPAPEGWQLVPVEPTEAMCKAAANTPGIKAIDAAAGIHQLRGYPMNTEGWNGKSPIEQAWAAMLAAAKAGAA